MNQTSTHRLLSAANGATALLGQLNLADLPPLSTLSIGQNHRDGWKTGVQAQLTTYGLSELEQIDAIRTWAVALGGLLRLDAKDYRYGRHILPHDAEARELGTGVSRIETLEKLGIRNTDVIPQQEVADGINAARLMLSRCWFDAERCERGIEALKQYRREWDGKRQVWRERPLHDWASHAADAFRYGALSLAPVKTASRLVIPSFGAV